MTKPNFFITYGINILNITGISVRTSSTGKKQLEFKVKTRPLGDGFSGYQGSDSQLGTVKTIYYEDTKQLYKFIADIAWTLGVKVEVDKVNDPNIETYVEKVLPLLNKGYARYLVTGEEKLDPSNKIKLYLYLGSYIKKEDKGNGAALRTLKVEKEDSSFWKFNETYDIKKLEPSKVEEPVVKEDPSNDLPF